VDESILIWGYDKNEILQKIYAYYDVDSGTKFALIYDGLNMRLKVPAYAMKARKPFYGRYILPQPRGGPRFAWDLGLMKLNFRFCEVIPDPANKKTPMKLFSHPTKLML